MLTLRETRESHHIENLIFQRESSMASGTASYVSNKHASCPDWSLRMQLSNHAPHDTACVYCVLFNTETAMDWC